MNYDDIEEKLNALKLALQAYKRAREVEDEKQRFVTAAESELSIARDAAFKAAISWSDARAALKAKVEDAH